MHHMLVSACRVVQKAGAVGPLHITSAGLARVLYLQETVIFTQALLSALKMDTCPAFGGPVAPPCLFPALSPAYGHRAGQRQQWLCCGKEGTPCVGRSPGLPSCGHCKCGGSSPSLKTHGLILQVEKQGDTVRCSGHAALLQQVVHPLLTQGFADLCC